MVYIDNAAIAKLMDHAQLEQRMTPDLSVLRLRPRHLVNLQGLSEVLQPCGSVIQEVCYLQAGLILRLFLVEGDLQVSERQLFVQIKVVQRCGGPTLNLLCGLESL